MNIILHTNHAWLAMPQSLIITEGFEFDHDRRVVVDDYIAHSTNHKRKNFHGNKRLSKNYNP
jgi:hypothetical protein